MKIFILYINTMRIPAIVYFQISNKGFGNNTEFYKFKNLQQLKNLLKDDNVFNLD